LRKIIFVSIVLIGLASNAKAQTASNTTKNDDETSYISLLAYAGNKLWDEVKKRFNLTSDSTIKKEETAAGTKVNVDLATKNNKIKVSGSFTR